MCFGWGDFTYRYLNLVMARSKQTPLNSTEPRMQLVMKAARMLAPSTGGVKETTLESDDEDYMKEDMCQECKVYADDMIDLPRNVTVTSRDNINTCSTCKNTFCTGCKQSCYNCGDIICPSCLLDYDATMTPPLCSNVCYHVHQLWVAFQSKLCRDILTYCDVFKCCSAFYGMGEAVRGCRLSLETYHLLWCLKFGFETVIPDFLPDYPLNGSAPCSLRACSRSELRSDIWSQELRCSHREQARNEIMVAALTFWGPML